MDLDAILRCPQCKGTLEHQPERYVCHACRLAYPIVDGIPRFIPSDAKPVDEQPRPAGA